MWIKKTTKELSEPIKTSLILRILTFFESRIGLLIFFFLIMPFLLTVLRFVLNLIIGGEGHGYSQSFDRFGTYEAMKNIPDNLFMHLFLCAVLYCFWVLIFKVHKPTTAESKAQELNYVCDKCNKMTETNDFKICECGGSYFTFNEMKWIDD